jgi:hypothetical protein
MLTDRALAGVPVQMNALAVRFTGYLVGELQVPPHNPLQDVLLRDGELQDVAADGSTDRPAVGTVRLHLLNTVLVGLISV